MAGAVSDLVATFSSRAIPVQQQVMSVYLLLREPYLRLDQPLFAMALVRMQVPTIRSSAETFACSHLPDNRLTNKMQQSWLILCPPGMHGLPKGWEGGVSHQGAQL